MPDHKQTTETRERAFSSFAELWHDPTVQNHSVGPLATRPAARIESIRSWLRTWLRSRMRQDLGGAEESKLLRWRDVIHDACAQSLVDELERTRQIFYDQQAAWSRRIHRARFGKPGFMTRIVALLLWLRCRSETQLLNAARLRLESMRSQNEIIVESCEGLATIAACLYAKIKAEPHSDSKSAAHERRVEKLIRLEQEHLITQEVIRRGDFLKKEQDSLQNLTHSVKQQTAKALRYLEIETVRQVRLRHNFESRNKANSRRAFERLIHSGFVSCAATAEQEFAATATRLEILQNEYRAIRKLLLVRLERLGSYADLTRHSKPNQAWPKGTEGDEQYSTRKNQNWYI